MRIQDKIHQLMWDRRYVRIPDDYDTPVRVVLLRDATLADRNYALYIHETEEMMARKAGVSTEGEIFVNARKGGYWTENDELILKEADDHIQYLEHEASRKGFAARRRQIEAQIQETRDHKVEVECRQQNLMAATAEYHAHAVAVVALLQRLVLDLDGQLLWPTEEAFVQFRTFYPDATQFLMHSMLTEGIWETADIREVARNIEWRLFWTLSRENLDGLFGCSIGDINFNQKLLIYWSRVYDNAFEDPKPPPQDVLDDDEKFDDWLANRDLERKEEAEGRRNKHSVRNHHEQMIVLDGEFIETCTCGVGQQRTVGLGLKKPHAEGCRYGYWRDYTQQEKDDVAAQVYGRNTIGIRRYIDKEQDKVLRAGMIQEQDLRGQHSRKILGANTNVIPIYKR